MHHAISCEIRSASFGRTGTAARQCRINVSLAATQTHGTLVPRGRAMSVLGRLGGLVACSALAFGIAPQAQAQVAIEGTAIQCEFCSVTQMRQAAASYGSGTRYVADIPGGVLRRYLVSCGSGGQLQGVGEGASTDSTGRLTAIDSEKLPGPPVGEELVSGCTAQGNVTAVEVDQSALDQFNVVRQIWIDTGGTFRKQVETPYESTNLFWSPPPGPLGGPNAYNVVSDGNFRAMLGTALANNGPGINQFSYIGTLANYIGAAINAFIGQTDGLRITLAVVFPDGSRVTYVYQYGDTSATYQPGSARTPVGQLIPDPDVANSPASTGTWSQFGPYGGQEDLDRFLEYMRSRGVQITGGGGEIRTVTCTWDGNTLSCVTR